jgi:hypothetical protein
MISWRRGLGPAGYIHQQPFRTFHIYQIIKCGDIRHRQRICQSNRHAIPESRRELQNASVYQIWQDYEMPKEHHTGSSRNSVERWENERCFKLSPTSTGSPWSFSPMTTPTMPPRPASRSRRQLAIHPSRPPPSTRSESISLALRSSKQLHNEPATGPGPRPDRYGTLLTHLQQRY